MWHLASHYFFKYIFVGYFGNDLILVSYCRDSLARLAPKLGSCASTYKHSTGEVLNAPR